METLEGAGPDRRGGPEAPGDVDALTLDPDTEGTSTERVPWLSDDAHRWIRDGVDVLVVVAAVLFVFAQLGPSYLVTDTTPAGGDMGAHVWGPAFLRDHLITHWRLSGWTMDWYAGFPAYQFYMVVPALLVVILNTGLHGWAAVGVVLLAGVMAGAGYLSSRTSWRRAALAAAVLVLLFGVAVPYGTAFKFVSVLGVVSLPLSAYLFGRLTRLPFPTPALLAAGSLVFLFNREPMAGGSGTGNIIGGNVTSTLAGEFSFSIALSAALVFLGLVVHGLHKGRRQWLAAVFFALAVTCHLIVGIFAAAAALLAFVIWPGRTRLRWLVLTGLCGSLLSAFWVLPFVGRAGYVNDMGWEKSPPNINKFSWWELLTNHPRTSGMAETLNTVRYQVWDEYLAPRELRWVLALAAVGLVVSIVLRIRTGWWFALLCVVLAISFVLCPEARLWNARLLPFYYLCLVVLAVIGAAEVVRALALLVAPDPERPLFAINVVAPVLGLAVILVIVGAPLDVLPGQSANNFAFGPINYDVTHNPARDWARWNYAGYEEKAAYPEYHGLVQMMEQVAADHGCGRAMWEYDGDRLNGYGTPMAPMLFPFWTDGCIASMEGLYFEASSTTPFHFINQSELSTTCSCPQRNLPYPGFNIDRGVEHLQLIGARYYVASTPAAVAAASSHAGLTQLATSGPWHVYLVADTPLVQALPNEPAVVTDHANGLGWVYGDSTPHRPGLDASGVPLKANGPAMRWYLDPARWNVFVASDGPAGWQRIASTATPVARPETGAKVSNVVLTEDGISFDTDQIGVPTLVKVSYFPNWTASGAQGPWRVAPNFMVVVPTASHVSLHYGRTPLDLLAWFATFAGIAMCVWLARRPPEVIPVHDANTEDVLVHFLDVDDGLATPIAVMPAPGDSGPADPETTTLDP